jgi:thymidine kinase
MIARLTLAAIALVSASVPALAASPDNRAVTETRIRQIGARLETVPDPHQGVYIRDYRGRWFYARTRGDCPRLNFNARTDIRHAVEEELKKRLLHCILVDEAQFLTHAHVVQLCSICDELDIPVLAYGLRTDFQANLFEGSAHLLALADNLVELKGICHCGRKATMNLRVDADGNAVAEGASVEIGGNDRYISLCRRHFMDKLAEGSGEQLRLALTRAAAAQ